MKRIAFYGGTFDPVHNGHVAIAAALLQDFRLDQFFFIPAFHAPHKDREPTSAFDRHAMLCLVTQDDPSIFVSRIEMDTPQQPYSYQTLMRLTQAFPEDEIFFVMGADSWADITSWREWERVLSLTNHIVVTRPRVQINFSHVGDAMIPRITDLRDGQSSALKIEQTPSREKRIYFSDSVNLPFSATEIRYRVRTGDATWKSDVPNEVANYIEKYQIYT